MRSIGSSTICIPLTFVGPTADRRVDNNLGQLFTGVFTSVILVDLKQTIKIRLSPMKTSE